jgi:KDO2-lipid IV(A) lauroyltransferase
MQAVKEGRAINVFADQDMRTEGIFVPFFGRPASTTPSPAFFALRCKVPIVPIFLIRTGPTRHRLHFCDVINPQDYFEGDQWPTKGETSDKAVHDITVAHVKVLEDMIRLYPAQYFWFHRRWKSTPESVAKRKRTLARRRAQQAAVEQGTA